jgi:hypothetical protein
MKYIKKTYLEQIELDDLDAVWQEQLMGPTSEGHDYDLVSDEQLFWAESEPIFIDTVISTLEGLKKEGANFVEVESNCDHHSYTFSGVSLELLPDSVTIDVETEILKNRIEEKKRLIEQTKLIEKNHQKSLKDLEDELQGKK